MSTETNVNSLIINKMSETKYSQITPVEGEMYATPDTHIATKEWTESRINDIMNIITGYLDRITNVWNPDDSGSQNSDLNTYKNPGFYVLRSGTGASTWYSGCGATEKAILLVSGFSNPIVQILFPISQDKIYKRTYNNENNTWSSWVAI